MGFTPSALMLPDTARAPATTRLSAPPPAPSALFSRRVKGPPPLAPPLPQVVGLKALPYTLAVPLCAPRPPCVPPPPVVVERPGPELPAKPPPVAVIVPLTLIVPAVKLVDPIQVIVELASSVKVPAVKSPPVELHVEDANLTAPGESRVGEMDKNAEELLREKSVKFQP